MRNIVCLTVVAVCLVQSSARAQMVQEYLLHMSNPHADILPHPLYNAWIPYRKAYNRPRLVGGFVAHLIEPTSQSAMAWEENYHEGNYDRLHIPAHYHTYYYPKPWEAMNIGGRPAKPSGTDPQVPYPADYSGHNHNTGHAGNISDIAKPRSPYLQP